MRRRKAERKTTYLKSLRSASGVMIEETGKGKERK
jgi:hypothetical protein